MTWETVGIMARVLVFTILAIPVLIVLGALVWYIYRFWRVWQANEATLRKMRLERLSPDIHGFSGVITDVGSGAFRDLDTGEDFTLKPINLPAHPDRIHMIGKQRWLAALSGANLHRAVTQVLDPKQEPTDQVIELGAGPWLEIEDGPAQDDELVV